MCISQLCLEAGYKYISPKIRLRGTTEEMILEWELINADNGKLLKQFALVRN